MNEIINKSEKIPTLDDKLDCDIDAMGNADNLNLVLGEEGKNSNRNPFK